MATIISRYDAPRRRCAGIFGLICFFIFVSSFASISGRSSVPSENCVQRYKENGDEATFLATDHADITVGNSRGSRVGCLSQMQAACLPLQKTLPRLSR